MNHYNIGKNNPMYGRKHSQTTKDKMRIDKISNNNPQWKGDDVGNNPLHCWVRRHLSIPDLCQTCSKKPAYDLSNITGIYTRDFNNWKYQCRSCHMKFDILTGVRKGIKHSEASKKKIGESSKGRNIGRKHTIKELENMRKAWDKRRNNHKIKNK